MEARIEGPLYYVSLAGETDGPQAEDMYRAVLRECVAGGCSKLLLDCRELSGEFSTMDRFSFGKVVADENAALLAGGSGRQVRVALVGRLPLIEERRFGETVATNRGALVKVTQDLASAYRWLGLDPPGE
jgi:hypothetical protein